MKILVYSTEENTRETAKLILGDRYDMILTDSLEQCRECIKNTDIKVMILDIDKQENPTKDVQSLLSDFPNLKILGLGRNEQIALEIINAGAKKSILKPIKSDFLLEACK